MTDKEKKSDSLKPASKVPECPYTDEKLYEAYCAGQNSLIQGGWKSPSEVEALIKDERAKVLKEVGEWLIKKFQDGWRSHGYSLHDICPDPEIFELTFYKDEIDNLKQGKLQVE